MLWCTNDSTAHPGLGYIVVCTEVYAFNVLPVEKPGGPF
jgi:hypothetical protein